MHWNNHAMTLPGLAPPEDADHEPNPRFSRPPQPPEQRSLQVHGAFALPFLRRGATVLDLGCGSGAVTTDLAQAVFPGTVWGIGWQPHQVAQARRRAECLERVNTSFVFAEDRILPFPDATFDLVFSLELSGGGLPASVPWSELRRVLRPGGFFAAALSDWESVRFESSCAGVGRALVVYRELTFPDRAPGGGGASLAKAFDQPGFERVHESSFEDRADEPGPTADSLARELDDLWRPHEAGTLREGARDPGAALIGRWHCSVARLSD